MTEKIIEALKKAESLLESKDLDSHAAQLLMQFITDKSNASLLADMREPLTPHQKRDFWKGLNEMLDGKPVQHIIGEELFYGYPFKVNEHVLIPRPETEELVQGALYRAKKLFASGPIKVADIGTGSGAIAISFKKERPDAEVTATDISREALAVAQRNADRNQAEICFVQGDLAEPLAGKVWDVILSNPPYIALEEAQSMSKTVLDYEPHHALFAEENGLFFYKRLAKDLPKLMNKRALIGVEIGHQQGESVHALFAEAFPDAVIETVKDINGKDRMIFCEIV
ncbi:peptide chain release factor N(5)-glutamine methyltransferase [Sporosarcina sp. Te-1]|uniref:peptide chain release factor N(5)-glutamine methyltransferase n=1 Tax=Sporosarcina sp. Te-1 TaxID=2818390 RepID=UPI001A9F0940|nr:peptide chain release factor N(5)-glutamine methyltransferase [Sporosarcina sp. Te-1]QTD40749.1 peptide chain release factor N(5)-glutamine methyltransferase [Sporosarcina sp. Te-1]